MKTNYLLDKKTIFSGSNHKNDNKYIKVFLIIALILLLGGGVIYRFLAEPVFTVTAPIVEKSNDLAYNNLALLVGIFTNKEDLIIENNKLKNKLSETLVTALEYKALQEEIINLRQFRLPDNLEVVVAKVIKNGGLLNYDGLVLDIGRQNIAPNINLTVGQKVIISDNVLLGELVEVLDKTSKVGLYSTPNRQTNVQIGPANVKAVAKGQGSGNYIVSLPVGLDFKVGDVVTTITGDREYIIGVVENITKTAEVPFQKLYIKQPVNLSNLSFVAIQL
ncbi:MAG: rod shape-determining protein MreC [Candidatus Paceibacterota bacterium]